MIRLSTAAPFTAIGAALALTACASAENGDASSTPPPLEGRCDAEAGQSFVGQKATAETGKGLMEATGAARLRWVPPRTAVTMDFQADRLTVSYDDDMVIERVSCT